MQKGKHLKRVKIENDQSNGDEKMNQSNRPSIKLHIQTGIEEHLDD
jgi:hypothetical protein